MVDRPEAQDGQEIEQSRSLYGGVGDNAEGPLGFVGEADEFRRGARSCHWRVEIVNMHRKHRKCEKNGTE